MDRDRGRPEPVLFLELAGDAMEEYHRAHREYPPQWHQLDFTFVNGPYRADEPDIRPAPVDKDRWKPRNCKYTYQIAFAAKDSFVIRAISPQGAVSCQIRNGMDSPVINITEEQIFHEYYRSVARVVIDELRKDKENPSEFYAEIAPGDPGKLIIHLWHQDAFGVENLRILGNPRGKCRDFHYDLEQKKITNKLYWQ